MGEEVKQAMMTPMRPTTAAVVALDPQRASDGASGEASTSGAAEQNSAPTVLSGRGGWQPSERPVPPELVEDRANFQDYHSRGRNNADSPTSKLPSSSTFKESLLGPKRRSSVSNPSFEQLLQGLMFQQECIRSTQLQLQDMSAHLDAVIRGDAQQQIGAFRFGRSLGGSGNFEVVNPDAQPPPTQQANVTMAPNAVLPPSRRRTLQYQLGTQFHMNRSGGSFEKVLAKEELASQYSSGTVVGSCSPKARAEVAQSDVPVAQISGKSLATIITKSSRLLMKPGSAMGPERSLRSYVGTQVSSGLASRNYWFCTERGSEDSDVLAVAFALGRGEDIDTQKMIARVRDRLGVSSRDKYVSAFRLHKTLQRLGAKRYSRVDCSIIIHAMGESARQASHNTLQEEENEYSNSSNEGMLFKDFATLILIPEEEFLSRCNLKDERLHEMILTIREILTSGDANRLVAELTQVNVDDLAQPPRVDRLSEIMEPIMTVVIVLSCIAIGWHANELHDDYDKGDSTSRWFWVDCVFTLIFLTEIALKIYNRGFRWFLRGPEQCWNCFDTILVFLGMADVLITLAWRRSGGIAVFSVVRIIRLVRLGRLFRMFRMKRLKELSLMLVGVVAGMRTLLWAVVLLFATVYILGVFATLTLGGNQPEGMQADVCADVPMAMFTVYRCLMADCIDQNGRSLVYMYADEFGAPFVLGYVASTTFVVFGVFNLICAIYIESTLAAAKSQRKMDRNESIRVARLARELLKKFAMAQTLLDEQDADCREHFADSKEFRIKMSRASQGMHIKSAGDLLISRDTFACALRDPEVQNLLDALDISSDRMHLFDILDADDSGDVEAAELIRGLLRVRGEAKKSDVVANLLAVRAAQNMIRKVDHQQQEMLEAMKVHEAFAATY